MNAQRPSRPASRSASAKSKRPPSRTQRSTPRRTRTRTPTPSPEARLSALESRLSALPVDALIDLRDGLEDLLAADTLDEAALRRLLDSVQL